MYLASIGAETPVNKLSKLQRKELNSMLNYLSYNDYPKFIKENNLTGSDTIDNHKIALLRSQMRNKN